MRNVAILTEARSSYGYLRPIVRLIEDDPDIDYSLIVTNQHLLPDFGYSVEEIESDGLRITDRINSRSTSRCRTCRRWSRSRT